MTNGLVQHIAVEESTSIQWVKGPEEIWALFSGSKDDRVSYLSTISNEHKKKFDNCGLRRAMRFIFCLFFSQREIGFQILSMFPTHIFLEHNLLAFSIFSLTVQISWESVL